MYSATKNHLVFKNKLHIKQIKMVMQGNTTVIQRENINYKREKICNIMKYVHKREILEEYFLM